MKIEVSIRITDKVAYDVKDVAAAKLEIEAPWDDIKPTAIHRALDGVIEDVTERVGYQLTAVHKAQLAAKRAAELDELADARI